jgi:16S rRNA (guanine966-N2)-methyltransferase
LRIISGTFKGRRLHPPASLPVRPTTDFAKEGLFNILNRMVDYEEVRALDLFAGTGGISFEFYSRGVPSVMAVDIERTCVTFINHTAEQFGMKGLQAIRANYLVFLKRSLERFDVVFADPPYDMNGITEIPALVAASAVMNPGGLLALEHSDRYDFKDDPNFLELRRYGRVHFSFFRMGKG